MKKPDWLNELRPQDRQQAERWLAQVGESRFLQIAKAATSIQRPKHRPRAVNAVAERFAILFWLTHPGMTVAQAAVGAARSIQSAPRDREIVLDGLDEDRFQNMTLQNLTRITRDALVGMPVGLLIEAEEEAARLHLQIRSDWERPFVSTSLRQRFNHTVERGAGPAAITHRNGAIGKFNRNTATGERMLRLSYLLKSLEGHVDLNSPIDRYSSLLSLLLEAVKDL